MLHAKFFYNIQNFWWLILTQVLLDFEVLIKFLRVCEVQNLNILKLSDFHADKNILGLEVGMLVVELSENI